MTCVFFGPQRRGDEEMKTYIYENYKEIFPDLKGHDLTDALIFKALREHGVDTEGLKVIRDHMGKPFLGPRSAVRLHISVSHCAGTFAVVISDRNCGIDIQEAKDTAIEKIAERFFTDEECGMVARGGKEAFFRIWTRKEAYAKYTGGGLGRVIKGAQVIDRDDVEFIDSVLENGMYCSICVQGET